MERDNIFYTVVDSVTGEEQRLEIDFERVLRLEPTVISFPKKTVSMDPQQLAELGYLLIALSKHDYDMDSVYELIEGYDCGLVV